MNGKPILIKNGDAYEFPLCASDTKKDYGNAVDLTNVATYTTTVDGYLVSDSGDKPINKGTIINNPNKTSILFVPKRNSSLLPQETTASQIPCFNGSSNVEVELEKGKVYSIEQNVNIACTNKDGTAFYSNNVQANIPSNARLISVSWTSAWSIASPIVNGARQFAFWSAFSQTINRTVVLNYVLE